MTGRSFVWGALGMTNTIFAGALRRGTTSLPFSQVIAGYPSIQDPLSGRLEIDTQGAGGYHFHEGSGTQNYH